MSSMVSMGGFVIPVQAEIQLLKGWTPAYAGVTVLFWVFV